MKPYSKDLRLRVRTETPTARRADRRLGAVGASLPVARAVGLRGAQASGSVRFARRGPGGRDRLLAEDLVPQGLPLRVGGHGLPVRSRGSEAPHPAARDAPPY